MRCAYTSAVVPVITMAQKTLYPNGAHGQRYRDYEKADEPRAPTQLQLCAYFELDDVGLAAV